MKYHAILLCRTEYDTLRRLHDDEEARLREELRSSLTKQQEQWQASLAAARQEIDTQRTQITERYAVFVLIYP